jgi:pimeloyl-ACP methyl ester carboxylesterase
MPFITLKEQSLHYQDEGSGEPLVLLHANSGDSLDLDAITPSFDLNYRLIRLDWPDYGEFPSASDAQPCGTTQFLELSCAFVDALALPPHHLLSTSVGRNVAARFALANPSQVLTLTLVSSGGFTPQNALVRGFCRLLGNLRLK